MDTTRLVKGLIVAVCTSRNAGVPKYPQTEVLVDEFGLRDDFHAGPTRISRRTGKPKFNDRQISIVAKEVLNDLNRELGTSLKPGDFGENITTEGLGDLGNILPGMLIRIGDSVIVSITEQNEPCVNLQAYHRLVVKKSYGRRGVLGTLASGAGSILQPGMPAEIILL